MIFSSRVARGVASVSLGSLVVQLGGALGQIVYAIWLTPSDFGVWAAASASIFFVSSLVNGGEANGYLAAEATGLGGVLSRAMRVNVMLSVLALLVAGLYISGGEWQVSFMVVFLAIDLPIQGRANLFVAAFIKNRLHSELVLSQVFSTGIRLAVGISVASVWHSPFALALAMMSYSITLVFTTRWLVRSGERRARVLSSGPPPATRGLRFDRALHQFTQGLPNQIDYFVVSLVSSVHLLGLYFFAYQATSSLAGIISGPLSKTVMAELSGMRGEKRERFVGMLLMAIIAASSFAISVLALLIFQFQGLLPQRWSGVVAPFAILLAGVPARFAAPISESLNMVNGKWRRSSAINLIDTVGTAVSATAALSGDVVLLAVAVSSWKVLFGSGRVVIALEAHRVRVFMVVVVPVLASFVSIAGSVMAEGSVPIWVALSVCGVCSVQFVVRRRCFP